MRMKRSSPRRSITTASSLKRHSAPSKGARVCAPRALRVIRCMGDAAHAVAMSAWQFAHALDLGVVAACHIAPYTGASARLQGAWRRRHGRRQRGATDRERQREREEQAGPIEAVEVMHRERIVR